MINHIDSKMVKKQQLIDVWHQCEKHYYYLNHAKQLLLPLLPISASTIEQIDDEQMRIWDQFVHRFTKLQDTLGARFYTSLLDYLQEPCATQPMIDKLNRLEALGLLASVLEWGHLRDLRNHFSHDYPQSLDLKASYLNAALVGVDVLQDAMRKAGNFLQKSGLL